MGIKEKIQENSGRYKLSSLRTCPQCSRQVYEDTSYTDVNKYARGNTIKFERYLLICPECSLEIRLERETYRREGQTRTRRKIHSITKIKESTPLKMGVDISFKKAVEATERVNEAAEGLRTAFAEVITGDEEHGDRVMIDPAPRMYQYQGGLAWPVEGVHPPVGNFNFYPYPEPVPNIRVEAATAGEEELPITYPRDEYFVDTSHCSCSSDYSLEQDGLPRLEGISVDPLPEEFSSPRRIVFDNPGDNNDEDYLPF